MNYTRKIAQILIVFFIFKKNLFFHALRKHSLILFFHILLVWPVMGQKKFEEAVTFQTKVTGDFMLNFFGGKKTGYTYIGMEEFSVMLNTEFARWWKGGILYLHGINTHGKGPSEVFTGDLQVLSNLEAGDYTGLYECFFKQEFGSFSILVGQHDLNSEFIGTKYGGTFVNSSFGIAPSISLNMPVSIYPVAAPCVLLKYQSENSLEYKLAFYDGDPGNFETNRFNLQWNISNKQGVFSIAELKYDNGNQDNATGMYRLGTYYHSGNFKSYQDTTTFIKGNFGIYIIIDQALFNRSLHGGRGLCFFIQAGITPQKINQVNEYFGAGLRYHSIFSNRFYDELGIAIAQIRLGKDYRGIFNQLKSSETALEATYKFNFSKRYSVQPCIQYIIHPGAGKYNNCLVSLLRFSLSY